MAGQQGVGQLGAHIPAQLGGERLGVERVEVPAGGQDVGATSRQRATGAGRHVTAVEAVQQVDDLAVGLAQSRHKPVAHPAHRGQRVSRCCPVARRGLDQQEAAPGFDRVEGEHVIGVEAELRSDGGAQRWDLAVRQASDGQQEIDERLALRDLPEGVQPAADLGILEPAQVAVDMQQHIVEVVLGGCGIETEVAVDRRFGEQLPDALAQWRQLRRIQRGELRVLVEHLLELRHVVVRVGPSHRRQQVVDHHGVGAALGLCALAGVVHHERVEERDVAQRGIGPAAGAEGEGLAG